MNLRQWLKQSKTLHQCDEGAGIIEYAFLVILIAIVAIVAVSLIGTTVSSTYVSIAGHI